MPVVTSASRSRREAAAHGERGASGAAGRARRRAATPYLFLAPGFVLFAALIIYPMIRAFQMSFYDWNIVAGAASRFTGWDNYVRAYHDPVFWRALANSGIYMAFTVPPQIILGLFVASLLRGEGHRPGAVPGAVLPAGGHQLGGRVAAVPTTCSPTPGW